MDIFKVVVDFFLFCLTLKAICKGEAVGLDGHIQLRNIGVGIPLFVVGFAYVTREGEICDLLGVLSVVGIGAFDFKCLTSLPLMILLYHIHGRKSRGFGKFLFVNLHKVCDEKSVELYILHKSRAHQS